MLQRRQLGLGALALAGARAWPALAADASVPPLRIVYSDSYAPFSWREADGRMAGALVDAVEVLGRASGLVLEHRGYPWPRAQAMVEMGEADGLCTLAITARQVYALFCDEPALVVQFGVAHRADDARPADIRSIEDMRRLRQGSYRGSGVARQYLETERIQWDNDAQSVLRRIALGTLDIMVEGELVTRARLKEFGLEKQIGFTPLPFLPRGDYCVGLRRSLPNAAELVRRINAAAKAARRAGTLDAVLAKYR